jgi:hypothetical protein
MNIYGVLTRRNVRQNAETVRFMSRSGKWEWVRGRGLLRLRAQTLASLRGKICHDPDI